MRAKVEILRVAPVVSYGQRKSRTVDEATQAVHRDFQTRAGAYSAELYHDEHTAAVYAAVARARRAIKAVTLADGIVASTELPTIQTVWGNAVDTIQRLADNVRANWQDVQYSAQVTLGQAFDAAQYPRYGDWRVSASLSVTSMAVPAALDDATCGALRHQAEAALRDTLSEAACAAVEEVKQLVKDTAASKRAEVTRRAAVKRIVSLRRNNLLADPAFDAVCSEALRELRANDHDVSRSIPSFFNPFAA